MGFPRGKDGRVPRRGAAGVRPLRLDPRRRTGIASNGPRFFRASNCPVASSFTASAKSSSAKRIEMKKREVEREREEEETVFNNVDWKCTYAGKGKIGAG